MSSSLDTGGIRVDDRLATAVAFEAARAGERLDRVALRFLDGDRELARASLGRAEALALLGERNLEAIEARIRTARPEEDRVRGALEGRSLHYRELRLASLGREPENTFEQAPLRMTPLARLAQGQPAPAAPAVPVVPAAPGPAAPPAALSAASPVRATPDPRAMPAHIAAKFLRQGDGYYFDARTIAFTDLGAKLRAETENRAVIRDLVEIARARGWQAGVVRGTESFRRALWQEAYAQGLPVEGYTPTALELQAAQRERERRHGANELARQAGAAATLTTPGVTSTAALAPTPQPPAAASAATATASAPTVKPAQGVIFGTLLEHGRTPERQIGPYLTGGDYTLKLRREDGREEVFRGPGVEEALRVARTRPVAGEVIGLYAAGPREVTVLERDVDAHGNVQPPRPVRRTEMQWVIEPRAYFAEAGRLEADLVARGLAPAASQAPSAAASAAAAAPAPAGDRGASPRAARTTDPSRTVVHGTLLAHGAAPYKFDRRNDASYYVKVALPDGRERTFWGAGLEEAVREARTRPAPGDAVGVRIVGQRDVTLVQRTVDEHGEVREKPVHAKRNDWVVEKSAHFAEPGRLEREVAARGAAGDAGPVASATPAPSAAPPPPSARDALARPATREAVYGTLIAQGRGLTPGLQDPSGFAVQLKLADGRIATFAGEGLEEALNASRTRPAIGDVVGIGTLGRGGALTFQGVLHTGQGNEVGYYVSGPVSWVIEQRDYFAAPGRFERDLAARSAATNPHPSASASPTSAPRDERAGDRQLAAARNARATQEALERRQPEVAQAVFTSAAAREQFVQAFIDAGLVRPDERDTVMRVFEAKVAERERRGQPVQFSGKDVNAAIEHSVAHEAGRRATQASSEKLAAQVMTPKPRVRDDAHVRG